MSRHQVRRFVDKSKISINRANLAHFLDAASTRVPSVYIYGTLDGFKTFSQDHYFNLGVSFLRASDGDGGFYQDPVAINDFIIGIRRIKQDFIGEGDDRAI